MNYAGAGLIVLSSDCNNVLLVHDARSGKWGFPKGHREASDDSDLQTAMRECYEETGLVMEDYAIYGDPFKITKGGQSYLFRYAILHADVCKEKIKAGPAYEIAGLEWVPLQTLLAAANVVDGNKYLRTWISDVQTNASKKSVYLFKSLLSTLGGAGAAAGAGTGTSPRLFPAQESVGSNHVVTCA
jgi:8-oxo-dGTP pyrophosphatase MutT (NUDIX family)